MAEFDTIIRGGLIIDGTRLPRFRDDLGIKDGKVAKIGRLNPTVVDNLSRRGPPFIVRSPRCGLMLASPLGPAEQCLLWDNPPPHQSP